MFGYATPERLQEKFTIIAVSFFNFNFDDDRFYCCNNGNPCLVMTANRGVFYSVRRSRITAIIVYKVRILNKDSFHMCSEILK